MERMERSTESVDGKPRPIVITDEMLEQYSDYANGALEEDADDERPVLIEAGLYQAELLDWTADYKPMYKKWVLTMKFQIGDHVISGWFNVKPSAAKTTVKAGWKSTFLRMYQECFDTRLTRKDRIPVSRFENVPLQVEVRTIEKDSKQKPLAPVNHYSRVSCIHRVL